MNNKIEMINLINDHKVEALVTQIEWERVILNIYIQIKINEPINTSKPFDFYAVNGHYLASAKFKAKQLSRDIYHLSINITNPGNNRCLHNGTYSIIVCQNNYIFAKCSVSHGIHSNLENLSRNFLYCGRSRVFTVTLFMDENADCLPLIIHIMDSLKHELPCFRSNQSLMPIDNYTSQCMNKKTIKKRIHLKEKKRLLITFAYIIFLKFNPYKKNGILFMSEQSDKPGANLTSLYNRIIERNLDKNYKIYFYARKATSERQGISSWFKLVCILSKCDRIFIDDHAPIFDWLELNKNTELIQMWHAGAGFKSSGYSRWGHKGGPGPKSCHRQYKYGIAGSKNIAPFFAEVFGINEEQILPTGMPRMDEFLNKNYRATKTKELYEIFPLCKGKKVILFAPTYRGRSRKNAYYPYELIDFNQLYEFCGDKYVILFKMHPWVSAGVPIKSQHKEIFIDVGTYPNINDLFYITDILITDYSSSIFEFSLMRKPMLFFAFDKHQYSSSRGFHRDYEKSAPGKVCYSFDEMMNALENEDFEYEKVEEYIEKHFDYIDSNACDRVIDWILLDKLPDSIKKKIDDKYQEIFRLNMLDFSSIKHKIETTSNTDDCSD